MRTIITRNDLKKVLFINTIREEAGDREKLLQRLIKEPELIKEIVITEKEIHITTN